MSDQPKLSMWPAAFLLLAAVAFAYAASGGCQLPGWQIATPIGRVRVQPVIVPKIEPPKTRCLIFGYDSCPGCRTLHRTTREMSRDGWRVGDLPTDDIEHIDINGRDDRLSKYRHGPSYPDLIVVDQAGKVVSRKGGALSAAQLAAWIRGTRS